MNGFPAARSEVTQERCVSHLQDEGTTAPTFTLKTHPQPLTIKGCTGNVHETYRKCTGNAQNRQQNGLHLQVRLVGKGNPVVHSHSTWQATLDAELHHGGSFGKLHCALQNMLDDLRELY